MPKEVWVKKTIWRRYLINDEHIEAAEMTLNKIENADEIIADYFDINKNIEYDNEKVITPIQFEIKEI